MAMTPEGRVKQRIKKVLDEYKASYFYPATGGYGKSGVSDIVVCYRGRFVAIEAKATPKQKPTALQAAYLADVTDAGGYALVINCDNVANVRCVLEGIKQERRR